MLPLIVVVCDDTRTAVAYFTILKHEVKDRKILHVHPAPFAGATADAVIEFAKEKAPKPQDPDDSLFVLVDLDTNPDQPGLQKKAASHGIALLFSNPCFEIWTLAHLEDTGELFSNCGDVLSRVKAKWRGLFGVDFGNKAQADYGKLRLLRDVALARCEQRNPRTNQSWTEVWRAVKAILT